MASTSDSRNVFVVHGRNERLRRAMFEFLRSIGLNPLEWPQLVAMTSAGSPYIGEVLDTAFDQVQAVVVLLTPDEITYLDPSLTSADDPDTQPAPQARPNVLFEAGMALGRHPKRTMLVEVGQMREFSDVAGRHAIRMTNDGARRQELAQRLETAGCPVNLSGIDWHDAGDFTAPPPPGHGLLLGRRVPSTHELASIRFDAAYHDRARSGGYLQIINRGTETAYDVELSAPDEACLDLRRVETIEKIPGNGRSVSVQVFNFGRMLGGGARKTAFDLSVKARSDSGERVEQEVFIDTHG